jgi:hypothetical protein
MDYGLWTMDYGLWTMDYGLWTMDYGLWTMDYGLWTMDYGLSTPSGLLLFLLSSWKQHVIQNQPVTGRVGVQF